MTKRFTMRAEHPRGYFIDSESEQESAGRQAQWRGVSRVVRIQVIQITGRHLTAANGQQIDNKIEVQ